MLTKRFFCGCRAVCSDLERRLYSSCYCLQNNVVYVTRHCQNHSSSIATCDPCEVIRHLFPLNDTFHVIPCEYWWSIAVDVRCQHGGQSLEWGVNAPQGSKQEKIKGLCHLPKNTGYGLQSEGAENKHAKIYTLKCEDW